MGCQNSSCIDKKTNSATTTSACNNHIVNKPAQDAAVIMANDQEKLRLLAKGGNAVAIVDVRRNGDSQIINKQLNQKQGVNQQLDVKKNEQTFPNLNPQDI